MAEHPLLVFPAPVASPREPGRASHIPSALHFPDARRQGVRLNPEFQRLVRELDQRNLELRNSAVGILPDQVLVLETVGTVQNFVSAVRRVNELEWLAEAEVDDLEPDDDFFDYTDDRPISRRLFLVMTNAQALRTLIMRFDEFQRNPDAPFPRGLAPLKQLFTQLRTVRFWGPEDRIAEFGLLENWRFLLEHAKDTDMLPFEADLWFNRTSVRRLQAERRFEHMVLSLGGEIVQRVRIPEISYHGILGRIPAVHASALVAQSRNHVLLLVEDLMFLRPTGQWAVPAVGELASLDHEPQADIEPNDLGSPVLALLDGLPLTGHNLLEGRLVVDDPDGYEEYYPAEERQHGTGMASLICHGDLAAGTSPISRLLYVRPILRPRHGGSGEPPDEMISEDQLAVDLVHRAVVRMFDGDDDEDPEAPGVKAINLSVCDSRRPFFRDMSPMARLLDWLSVKYQVLFLVSAGNHLQSIELNVPHDGLHELDQAQRESAVLNALAEDTRNRSLLSPAETLNGLTVGALHSDCSDSPNYPYLINPFIADGFPNVVSAQGPGHRRSVKPDIMLPGGRQLVREQLGNMHKNSVLLLNRSGSAPGQLVAWPGQQGSLNSTLYTRGTSNATALATRAAGQVLDVLAALRSQSETFPDPGFDTVLMKALLVHGAHCEYPLNHYSSILNGNGTVGQKKSLASRLVGYGSADIERVMFCTDHRVTVLGCGTIGQDEVHTLNLPLPPGLSGIAAKRRMVTTLAWLSPINCSDRNYRRARVRLQVGRELADQPIGVTQPAVFRGTVQHDVLEGRGAKLINDGDTIDIRVECRADAGTLEETVRYGLAITLEVPESVDIAIYDQIKERLPIRVTVGVDLRS